MLLFLETRGIFLRYVQQNDNWTDDIQPFGLSIELPFLLQIELEVNLLD